MSTIIFINLYIFNYYENINNIFYIYIYGFEGKSELGESNNTDIII